MWVDAGVLNPGDIFLPAPGQEYEILSIQSNTQLTLAANYLSTTAAGAGYGIIPIGLLPSTLAQQVKNTLASANTALASAVLSNSNSQGLTPTQQQNARTNIGALGAGDVGAGEVSISVAGNTNVTLTQAQANNQIITFTGVLTGNITVFVPAAPRAFFFYNNTSGAFTLTVSTPTGTGVEVNQGGRSVLVCDGVNIFASFSGSSGNVVETGSIILGGINGVSVSHNIGNMSYLVNVSPSSDSGGNVGEISYIKSANAVVIYNTGRANMTADYEISTIAQ